MLHSRAAAEVVNRLLPCGAEYVSATQHGPYINALFKLTDRSGPGGGPHSCGSGAGTTARVNFIISDGKITHWLRAPSQPGDNRTTPPCPGSSTGTATSLRPDGDLARHQHRPAGHADAPPATTAPSRPDRPPGPTPAAPPQTATEPAPKV